MSNAIANKTVLVLYDSSVLTNYQAMNAQMTYLANPKTTTIYDIAGLSDTAANHLVRTYLGTLATAGYTYDEIFVLSAVSSAGATGSPNYDTLAYAWNTLLKTASKGTLQLTVATDTSAGEGVTAINMTGGTGLLATQLGNSAGYDTYFNDLYVYVTGGTNAGYAGKIVSYSHTNCLATLGGAGVGSAFAGTSTGILVYSCTHMHVLQEASRALSTTYQYDVRYATQSYCNINFTDVHTSTNTAPLCISRTSKIYCVDRGTASSGTTTGLVDTTKTWVVNAYAGKWVYIVKGIFAGQYANILSNTATTLVCQYFNAVGNGNGNPQNGGTAWTVTVILGTSTTTPSSTSQYVIVDKFNDMFKDVYMEAYLKTYCNNLAMPGVTDTLNRMLDLNKNLNTLPYGAPVQDVQFIDGAYFNMPLKPDDGTVSKLGKAQFDAVTRGWTLLL